MLKNFINGAWVQSSGSQSVEILNPATHEEIGRCPLGGSKDVEAAVAHAQEAFLSWRKTPPIERAQYLFKIKAALEDQSEELAKSVTLENGKTLVEARGSVRRGIQMVETACGIPTLMMGQAFEDIASGIDCQAIRRPMGVFAGIAPFNFPAMVPFWFWPFAIATGNTFVLKPSERVPITSSKIFELIARTGLPKGVMNLVLGGADVVNALCTHPKIQGLSFVGSTPVAKHVYTLGSAHGKRVQALGGAKNFMVVLPDAIMESSARTALESIIGCAGERCLAGSVIIAVGKETYLTLEQLLVSFAKEIRVGNGLEAGTQMGPLISKAAKDRVSSMIQTAIDQGAKLLLDGRNAPDNFLKPTVLGGVTAEMEIAQKEIFGPVVCLAQADSLDQSITWINGSSFANTCTLFTTSGGAARKFCYEVDPSMIGINIGVPAPMSYFSFGGSKDSFFGDIKAHGQACMDFFTDTKTTITRWQDKSSIW